MPRRESYLTDDEDDDSRRRAGASGGGVPAWVWVVAGGGVLAVLGCAGLGFATFTRREAAVRQEVARAEVMRMEADRAQVMTRRVPPGPHEHAPEDVTKLGDIAKAYRDDPAAADARFAGQRLRVEIEVRKTGEGWVGTVASIGRGMPRDRLPNVYFMLPDANVAAGTVVEIEGTCTGLAPDPQTGVRLTFIDCRLIE